jgi:hypothetical protein
MEYGTLKNANADIDTDGRVWLWIKAGDEHVGIDLSAALSEPSFDETLKQWVRDQDPPVHG